MQSLLTIRLTNLKIYETTIARGDVKLKMIDPTSIALIFMFIIPSCLGVNQLHRVLNSKNNKFSLRSGILLFLTLGSLLRILFWVKVMHSKPFVQYYITSLIYSASYCRPPLPRNGPINLWLCCISFQCGCSFAGNV